MIHSLAGGEVREKRYFNFAKVKTTSGDIAFYINELSNVNEGDTVWVEYGKREMRAVVLRIDKNVREDMAPIPINKAKKILRKN